MIAQAAAELFCERGYHGVGIDEIARLVGVSGPAVYRHFPNKYAILVHATRDLDDAVLTAADEALAEPGPPEVRLGRLLAALAALAVERRRVGALYQWEGRYLTPEHRAEFRADLLGLVDRIVELVRGLRPGLPDAEARLLAWAALSVLGSPSTHRAALPRGRTEQMLRAAAWCLLTADLEPGVDPDFDADLAGDHGPLRPPADQPAAAAPLRPGSRRELLLTEAPRLFHRFGYHAVGIEDIGRAAGINASSVYRYFPGKADLLAAAYYRAAERIAVTTAGALAAADGPVDGLEQLARAYVELTFAQSDLVSVYLAENNNLPERDRHELRKAQRLHVEEWVRLLTGQRPELTAAQARLLVHAALNVVTDLTRAAGFDRAGGFDRRIAALALRVLRDTPVEGDGPTPPTPPGAPVS